MVLKPCAVLFLRFVDVQPVTVDHGEVFRYRSSLQVPGSILHLAATEGVHVFRVVLVWLECVGTMVSELCRSPACGVGGGTMGGGANIGMAVRTRVCMPPHMSGQLCVPNVVGNRCYCKTWLLS